MLFFDDSNMPPAQNECFEVVCHMPQGDVFCGSFWTEEEAQEYIKTCNPRYVFKIVRKEAY